MNKVSIIIRISNNFTEETKVMEGAKDDLQKAKKPKKKAHTIKDEGAFNTYIYRVLKEVSPETGISKNAMHTLN